METALRPEAITPRLREDSVTPNLRGHVAITRKPAVMRILRYLVIMVACLLLVAALPHVFLPKRWQDIDPGQHRATVIAVLGIPDADYFKAKQFDGWFNPFFVGASTVTVQYSGNIDVVKAVQIRTRWGFAYRDWSRGYRSETR
jgi:hypothetical protein